mmetsp:Transcript_31303/g.75666  ORF Transcript_31303/g.75666 Transcript_31303/m.75666 type:complete len:595 (-) Transcript_31303:15-1799(-)
MFNIRGTKMDDALAIGSKIRRPRRSAEPKSRKSNEAVPPPQIELGMNTRKPSTTTNENEQAQTNAVDGVPAEICISDDLDEKKPSYQVGEKVQAKYRGKGSRYYDGTIKSILPKDQYDIDYDDGDRDKALSVDCIRRPSLPNKTSRSDHVTGDVKQREDKTADTKHGDDMDDGNTFEVGQKVEAKYRGRGRRYYQGTIVRALSNGLYDVDYDDCDRDRNLPADVIRAIPDSKTPILGRDASSPQVPAGLMDIKNIEDIEGQESHQKPQIENYSNPENKSVEYAKGQAIEAKYRGRGRRWYKGTIFACYSNGTYDVQYADGDKDYTLSAQHIRAMVVPPRSDGIITPSSRLAESPKSDTTKSQKCKVDGKEQVVARRVETTRVENGGAGSEFVKGDKVEARFRGRGSRWYKGAIAACLPNGLYTVQYDDGDKDLRLSADAIRATGPKLPASPKLSSVCASHSSATDGDVSFVPTEKPRYTPKKDANGMPGDLSSVEDLDSQHSISAESVRESAGGHTNEPAGVAYSERGNRWHRGVVSKVKVVYLYEVQYADDAKDVNIPFEALRTQEEVAAAAIQVGTSVDVLSWQDRFGGSTR